MSNQSEHHEEYHEIVIRCMTTFQLLEEFIKMVLIQLELLTKEKLKADTYYNFEGKRNSILNSPMERLIKTLRIYTEDEELFKSLETIKNNRNHVAHQSFLISIKELDNEEALESETKKLEEWNKSAREMVDKMLKRWMGFDKVLASNNIYMLHGDYLSPMKEKIELGKGN